MFERIYHELRSHAPFTAFGAITGIIIMVFFRNVSSQVSYHIFYVLHPFHVLLSALATTSMYESYKCKTDSRKCNIFALLAIGYIGSIGIATLSDSVIPYFVETLLDMPQRQMHIGFIEKWWLIHLFAIAGIIIAYFKPTTKFSHYGHVLLSTWASLFHIIMASRGILSWSSYIAIFLFLFLAVWVPCCISDIAFPLLFTGNKGSCEDH